ncbi:Hypothetical predicted protein [Mytilus galloprovincialis]|uniref:G-protein coupled receptors family 1 profile domain-containing protein n=1 Tax=Mytilus galloprovincialis TaxID=29158 RepID=A0A8B6D2B4_MYTGA|nr:Hypothetical predicted protein [Mytilus galloprovincialis]
MTNISKGNPFMASDWKYLFTTDTEKDLLNVFIAGSVLSYVAMIFNIIVIAILARKNVTCPVAVLMQGLGLANFLTACCSYGLEPLFQAKYVCTPNKTTDGQKCTLPYPYCMFASHLSILTMTFHTVSNLITTSMGIYKVLAILFPIWTKTHMTNRKASVSCFISFLLSLALGLPRHFSLEFEDWDWDSSCLVVYQSLGVLEYSTLYYMILQIILSTCCSIVMVMSTIYIVYKRVLSSAFRGKMSKYRRRERRSMLMVVIILLVFLVTEIPKVSVYFWFCVTYLQGDFVDSSDNNIPPSFLSGLLAMRFEYAVARIMSHFTDILEGTNFQRSLVLNFALESVKIFTVLGCLSNFIVCIIMSSKIRNEINHAIRKPALRLNQK